jgi:hypothetical protein
MKRFFNNINDLHYFSLNLDCHRDQVQCANCNQSDTMVSHGFVYKQRSGDVRERVGKRLFCSNRGNHDGCGRTARLRVADSIAKLHYDCRHVFVFISALISQMSIASAYRRATGCAEPRNAYRWLLKMNNKLILYRCSLASLPHNQSYNLIPRSQQLNLLVPTLSHLSSRFNENSCSSFQCAYQLDWM